jgi:hypothetical protein
VKRWVKNFILMNSLFIFSLYPHILLSEEVDNNYIIYPKQYEKWGYSFLTGVSIAKLPVIISENEISHALWVFLALDWDYPMI